MSLLKNLGLPEKSEWPFKLLEIYPPFLFIGVKIDHISQDCRFARVSIPMRWYAKNLHGTLFGGNICAASDPIAALMLAKIFKNTDVWTKAHAVEFLKPAKERIEMRIEITDEDLKAIRDQLEQHGKATHTIEFDFWDRKDRKIAHVRNTVYLKRRSEPSLAAQS